MSRARGVSIGAALAMVLALGATPAEAALDCGDEVRTDRKLKQDLTCGAGESGLTIGANGVDLDLNGHTIEGTGDFGTWGVMTGGFNRATVRGGTIRAFGNGVIGEDAVELTVRNTKIKNAADESVRLNGMDDVTVENNVLSKAGNEIHVWALSVSTNVLVADNRLIGGGINFASGSGFKALRNEITSAGLAAIDLDVVGDVVVRDNEINGSEGDAIHVNGAAHEGIAIKSNKVEGASATGIFVAAGALSVRLTANTVIGSSEDGIQVAAGTDTVVRRNETRRNEDDGIDVDDTDTLVEDNVANGNGDLGIESESANGSGNTASNNGNPLQCDPASLCA